MFNAYTVYSSLISVYKCAGLIPRVSDLLLYREKKKNKEVKEYQRVDWFDHPDISPDVLVGKPRVRQAPIPPAV